MPGDRTKTPRHDHVVKAIADEMLKGTWTVGRSHLEYAARYKVDHSTVRRWSSEASLMLRVFAPRASEIREQIIASIGHARELAMARKKRVWNPSTSEFEEFEDPDVRNLLGALELLARVHGVDKPAEQAAEEVDAEELAELLRQQGYDVAKRQEPDT